MIELSGTENEDITATLSGLEEAIGYHFKDQTLLKKAITTSSYTKEHPDSPSYQRLELLGDRVISLILTENLMADRSLDEGRITFLKAELENNQRLAEYGEELGLRKCIRAREERDEISPKVVADVFEAICGAIYLDSGGAPGMQAVEAILRKFDIFEQLKAKITMAEDFLPIRNLFENKFREITRSNPDIRFSYESEGAAHQKQWRIDACAIRDPQTGRYVELHGVHSDNRWFGSKKEAETDVIEKAYRYMEAREWVL